MIYVKVTLEDSVVYQVEHPDMKTALRELKYQIPNNKVDELKPGKNTLDAYKIEIKDDSVDSEIPEIATSRASRTVRKVDEE